MVRRFFTTCLGMAAGLGVPFLWLLLRAYTARREWWDKWLQGEFHKHSNVYWVVAVISVGVFALIGYFIGYLGDEIEKQSESIRYTNLELTELASTDGLTGLFNTRAIHERLDVEMENSYRSPLTCLLVDIDHFKKINDTYGHPFGDKVLVEIARTLQNATRHADAVGRLGGEEFIVILPHTPGERAMIVAERIREAVESISISFEEKAVPVTVSLGLVSFPSEHLSTKQSLLQAVDEALYAAKKSGRNRIIVWQKPA